MTHTAPMADSAGQFSEPRDAPEVACLACKACNVSFQTWESSCGGWEDHLYRCRACGQMWWVEGIDS